MTTYRVFIEEFADSLVDDDDRFGVDLTLEKEGEEPITVILLRDSATKNWEFKFSSKELDPCLIENLVAALEQRVEEHGFYDRYVLEQPFAVGI